jgi:hypothetical protein
LPRISDDLIKASEGRHIENRCKTDQHSRDEEDDTRHWWDWPVKSPKEHQREKHRSYSTEAESITVPASSGHIPVEIDESLLLDQQWKMAAAYHMTSPNIPPPKVLQIRAVSPNVVSPRKRANVSWPMKLLSVINDVCHSRMEID